MIDLDTIARLLYLPGAPMAGCELTNDEALAWISNQILLKPYCLVRHWIWLDLNMSDSALQELQESGRKPAMLYAGQVIFDSKRRFEPGRWVRSTPLVSFSDKCLFETANTVYVLLGVGSRKTTELSAIIKIF
ncbi:TPA: hypothetical protein VDV10_006165 [Pseudomonas aeruginosa]|nr:hypothetical protein [Pseudomonas aeruginosa]